MAMKPQGQAQTVPFPQPQQQMMPAQSTALSVIEQKLAMIQMRNQQVIQMAQVCFAPANVVIGQLGQAVGSPDAGVTSASITERIVFYVED